MTICRELCMVDALLEMTLDQAVMNWFGQCIYLLKNRAICIRLSQASDLNEQG